MILLYHLVFPDSTPQDAWNAGLVLRLADFKRQLLWVKQHYQFVSLEDYVQGLEKDPEFRRRHFSLTFDDGYEQVFELVSPFLEHEKIPATFFSCTSHLQDKELLWFVYLNALCSEKAYASIEIEGEVYPLSSFKLSLVAWQKLIDLARQSKAPIEFSRHFAKKYPLPDAVVAKYMGISKEQLTFMGQSDLFDVGGHTHAHPFLDQLSIVEQLSEMQRNKNMLEDISGKPVSFFAYTGGIYNAESISAVKEIGFKAACAIKPQVNSAEWRFELARVDIYSPSMFKFKIKALGLEKFARRMLFERGRG